MGWKRRAVAGGALAVALAWVVAVQAAEACAGRPLAGADIAAAEVGFRTYFCKVNASPQCDLRWKNASGLLSRLAADPRGLVVGEGAFIAATAYVETGTKDFDPGAVETLGPTQLAQPYAKAGFYGRGWIQLTHEGKYQFAGKQLGIDLVATPEQAREPAWSYEILVRGMREGWIETYRSTVGGGGGSVPIRLGDFISATSADYDSARAVINANCVGKEPCPRVEVRPGQFLPPPDRLDAGPKAALAARRFESLLCQALPAPAPPAVN